jgi:anti-sigma factor RsiW
MSSDTFSGAADFLGYDEVHIASDVSDYVSGRLDPLAAREVERRAETDERIAAAIVAASTVRGRVVKRLKLKT